MGEPLDEDVACVGPHVECQGCMGSRHMHSMALYVSGGHGQSAPTLRTCWHCKGRGYSCRATTRCAPPHDLE
jgi:hypothetical protein